MNFLERNGFANPNTKIIREEFPLIIHTAVSDALEMFHSTSILEEFDMYLWRDVDFQAKGDYSQHCSYELWFYQKFTSAEWNYVLYYLEEFVKWLNRQGYANQCKEFKETLNIDFEKRNYAYRFVGDNIEEITSKEEIQAIEIALKDTHIGVKTHLSNALSLLSASNQTPDYRNSIKESISAVEALCRNITNQSTLDKALKKLESKGVVINKQMKEGLERLYYYTNDKTTGIRHALMDDSNEPAADEAIFMLVSCSAFINFISKKKGD